MKFKLLFLGLFLIVFFTGCSREMIVDKNQNQKDSQVVPEKQETETIQTNSNKENLGDFENIKEILNQNKTLKCQWLIEKVEQSNDADEENINQGSGGGIEKGEIYVKEGDFFQEIEITENSRKTVIKTLKKGDWFYQWNSLVDNQGMRMPFEKAKYSEFLKINKVYDWNCQEISNLEDIFQIPEGINFFNF